MIESETNFCLKSGCQGYCCENITIEATKFERRKIWPQASRVQTVREIKLAPQDIKWVFYTQLRRKHLISSGGDQSGFVLVGIVGQCPRLDRKGNCVIHAEREHAARNLKPGTKLCNEIRRDYNLPPLCPPEEVE